MGDMVERLVLHNVCGVVVGRTCYRVSQNDETGSSETARATGS